MNGMKDYREPLGEKEQTLDRFKPEGFRGNVDFKMI